jgi:hypothetical protein
MNAITGYPKIGPDFLDGMRDYTRLAPVSFSAADTQPLALPQIDLDPIKLPDLSGGKGGFGIEEGKLALGGLQTLGQLYAAWQSAKLANKSYKQNKKMSEANYAMQMKGWNEALDGRNRTREIVEGSSHNPGYYDRFKADELRKG